MTEMGTNIGHGHVFKRPDGMVSRCGGPTMCKECALDLAQINARKQADAVKQIIDVETSSHGTALDLVRDYEAKGYSVTMTHRLDGSNWWWRVLAVRAAPAESEQ